MAERALNGLSVNVSGFKYKVKDALDLSQFDSDERVLDEIRRLKRLELEMQMEAQLRS